MFAIFIKKVFNYSSFLIPNSFLVFEFMLPAIQISLFCLCIGREPYGLHMEVVNEEVFPLASTLFLGHLDNHTIIQVLTYGENWFALHYYIYNVVICK